MTRKCVLCKETNYRNTYSFFSAPKDPETRKKWQNAIAIENYSVTDDTYVCSKHFHKDDIITHWISGVPPHVISIKYKKCRLRPGAVPSRHCHQEESMQPQENSDDSDVCISNYLSDRLEKSESMNERDFLIPRTEEGVQLNNSEKHNATALHLRRSHNFNNYNYVYWKPLLSKKELLENGSSLVQNESEGKKSPKEDRNHTKWNEITDLMEDIITSNTNSMKNVDPIIKRDKQEQTHKENHYLSTLQKSSEFPSKGCNLSETEEWKHRIVKKDIPFEESLPDNGSKTEKNMYIDNPINNVKYNQLNAPYSMCNDISENELLFEDLLEVCTEVLLPRGWSCLVTSKGHTTTIVYLYMAMTKSGMPFTEKQVFVKSDMMLHCSAVNREINPLMHNLIREGKHLKIQNLLDIEELIDEFDQRTVCRGIYNTEGFQEIDRINVAYKDGIKWRHILCPLILNNDSARCTKCTSLSHTLQRKLKDFPVLSHNPSLLTKGQPFRLKYKRLRRQSHRYEFIKIFKQ